MDKVKIKDIRTGAIKEVKKEIAGDFIGTGNFEMVYEDKESKANKLKNDIFNKSSEENEDKK